MTDDRFLVVTGDVVEPDPVIVEIVQHRHAELVALPVVWLGELQPPSVGPVDVVVSPA